GIETALAVMKLYRIPCWASATAGLMEKFIPPEGIERVTVFGDNDASFTGQKAAYALAHRLAHGKGKIPVEVRSPSEIGMDFADRPAHKEAAWNGPGNTRRSTCRRRHANSRKRRWRHAPPSTGIW